MKDIVPSQCIVLEVLCFLQDLHFFYAKVVKPCLLLCPYQADGLLSTAFFVRGEEAQLYVCALYVYVERLSIFLGDLTSGFYPGLHLIRENPFGNNICLCQESA